MRRPASDLSVLEHASLSVHEKVLNPLCWPSRCADSLVRVCHDEGAEVMIATHNQKSIERAVSLMHELDVEPQQSGIYFGQLLGMADHLTFILGRNGYRVSILQLACSTFVLWPIASLSFWAVMATR